MCLLFGTTYYFITIEEDGSEIVGSKTILNSKPYISGRTSSIVSLFDDDNIFVKSSDIFSEDGKNVVFNSCKEKVMIYLQYFSYHFFL